MSGNASKHRNIGNGVRTKTVGSVDVAGYLTGGIKTGDDFIFCSQNLSVGVDLQTAHGVMNGRCGLHDIVGALCKCSQFSSLVKFQILSVCTVLIITINGSLQFLGNNFKMGGSFCMLASSQNM